MGPEEINKEQLKKDLDKVLSKHQDAQCHGEIMMRAQTWLDYESNLRKDYIFFVIVWDVQSNAAMKGYYIQLKYPRWRVLVSYAKKGSISMVEKNSNRALEACENKKGHHQCSKNIWNSIEKKKGRAVMVIVDDNNFYRSRATHSKNMAVTESIKRCYSETTGISIFKKQKNMIARSGKFLVNMHKVNFNENVK